MSNHLVRNGNGTVDTVLCNGFESFSDYEAVNAYKGGVKEITAIHSETLNLCSESLKFRFHQSSN